MSKSNNSSQQVHPKFVPFEKHNYVESSEEGIVHLVEGGCSYRWVILPENRIYSDAEPNRQVMCTLCLKNLEKFRKVKVGPIVRLD